MNRQDLALVVFKATALWFGTTGIIGVGRTLLTWQLLSHAWTALANSALFVAAAALIWLLADWLAVGVFPVAGDAAVGLTRADLWSTAILCTGLYLLAQALPKLAYWVVVWRSSRGTAYLALVGVSAVAYWGELAEALVRVVLGVGLIAGEDRVRALLSRLSREAVGSTLVEEAEKSNDDREEK